jgi:hypothetical protein
MSRLFNKQDLLIPLVASGTTIRGKRARARLGRVRPLPSAQIIMVDSEAEFAPEEAASPMPPAPMAGDANPIS